MDENQIGQVRTLRKFYENRSKDVQGFFKSLGTLLYHEELDLKIAMAYVFSEWERAQNIILTEGIIRLYKTDRKVTEETVHEQKITRNNFAKFYNLIFDLELPKPKGFKGAEDTRDATVHGKEPKPRELRNGIAKVLIYAERVNQQLQAKHKFKPIRKHYQGHSNSREQNVLDKKRTWFVLKGIGFESKKDKESNPTPSPDEE